MNSAISLRHATSNRVFSIGMVLAFQLIVGLSTTLGHSTNYPAEETSTAGWSGFGEDFDPDWKGETKQINWRRGGGGGTTGIVFTSGGNSVPQFDLAPATPIELIGSSRSIEANSVSDIYVAGEHQVAISGKKYSRTSPGRWYPTNRAYYAQVIDLDDLVLGRGNSLVILDSTVNDYSYSLNSRQMASSLIDPIVHKPSEVTGFASADFSATYQVHEPVSFELSGLFGGIAEIDASFSLTDHNSGEVYYEQTLSEFAIQGNEIKFSYEGEFSPGMYDLNFSSVVRSTIALAGVVEPGGAGEFSIDFRAKPTLSWEPGAGDFDDDGNVDSADLSKWKSSYAQFFSGDFDDDGNVDYSDYWKWKNLDLATDVTGDDRVDLDDFFAIFDGDKPGDADGDRDVDGNDFLMWQRTLTGPPLETDSELSDWKSSYGSHSSNGDFDGDGDTDGNDFLQWQRTATEAAGTEVTVENVPEPSGAIFLVIGTMLAVTRLRNRPSLHPHPYS